MSALVAALVSLTCAVAVLRVTLSGGHLAYVKESLTIPLIIAALVVIVLSGDLWWRELRSFWVPSGGGHRQDAGASGRRSARHAGHAPDHGCPGGGSGHGLHRHRKGQLAPAVGWALLVPFLVMSSVPPTPVGAHAARRSTDNKDASVVLGAAPTYAPLEAGKPVVDMTIRQFWERASFDAGRSLSGRQVRLVGFSSVDATAGGQGWALTRMAIMCCAADAFALKVLPLGVKAPAEGQWVSLEGVWEPDPQAPPPGSNEAGAAIPRIKVRSITPVSQPAKPYE